MSNLDTSRPLRSPAQLAAPVAAVNAPIPTTSRTGSSERAGWTSVTTITVAKSPAYLGNGEPGPRARRLAMGDCGYNDVLRAIGVEPGNCPAIASTVPAALEQLVVPRRRWPWQTD